MYVIVLFCKLICISYLELSICLFRNIVNRKNSDHLHFRNIYTLQTCFEFFYKNIWELIKHLDTRMDALWKCDKQWLYYIHWKNVDFVLKLVICVMAASSVNVSLDDIDLSTLRVSSLMWYCYCCTSIVLSLTRIMNTAVIFNIMPSFINCALIA